VTTQAVQAGGGTIILRAGRVIQLHDSAVSTSVQGGGEDAGNITLDAPFVILDGSQIIANAFEGVGGNIRIGANVFLADPASRVEASSALGIQGTVDLQAPVTSLSGTLAPLPQACACRSALARPVCGAGAGGRIQQFGPGRRQQGLCADAGGDQHGRSSAALDRGVRQVTAGKATSSKHTRGAMTAREYGRIRLVLSEVARNDREARKSSPVR
jgi:hypothetical protein